MTKNFRILFQFILIILSLLVFGCAKDLPVYTALGDLRVLTIIVDQPEVLPGTTVNFTPVLSDLNGAGRTLNYSISACIDPGVGVGVTPACSTPDAGTTSSGTLTIPAGASKTYTGAVPSFSLTMPTLTSSFSSQSAINQFNGVAYLVIYTLSVPGGGTSVNSFVRVILSSSSKATKNQNPTITSINQNSNPISATITIPTVATTFQVISPSTSSETYSLMGVNGSTSTSTEELLNTFFISDGTFDYYRTSGSGSNLWTPPTSNPSGRGIVLLVVTRDGRGGAAFQKIEMQ